MISCAREAPFLLVRLIIPAQDVFLYSERVAQDQGRARPLFLPIVSSDIRFFEIMI